MVKNNIVFVQPCSSVIINGILYVRKNGRLEKATGLFLVTKSKTEDKK